jgi:hypothetical protein
MSIDKSYHVIYNRGMRTTRDITLSVDIKLYEQVKREEANLKKYVPDAKVNFSQEFTATLRYLVEELKELTEIAKKGKLKRGKKDMFEFNVLPNYYDMRAWEREENKKG